MSFPAIGQSLPALTWESFQIQMVFSFPFLRSNDLCSSLLIMRTRSFYSLLRRRYIHKVSVQLVWIARGGALLMNTHILSLINQKVSRWVVGVLLIVLSGLKYSAGLVPFIVHPVINIYIYMHVYTFFRIFYFRNFSQPPSLRPSCCTSHKFSPRELNFCLPCFINVHEEY